MEKTSPDFKGNIPITDHAASATWSKRVALTTGAQLGILEKIMDRPEGKDFRALPEKETCAQEAPPHNEFPEDERGFALFSDRFCCVAGNHQRWTSH